jgi:hypothetical protein
MDTLTHQSDIETILQFESEYRERRQKSADEHSLKCRELTTEFQAAVRRTFDSKLPLLAPFAVIDELVIENGELPTYARVPVRIPGHSPITVYLQRRYDEKQWQVGDYIKEDGFGRTVALTVSIGSYYPREFNTQFSLAEALVLAEESYHQWKAQQKREEEMDQPSRAAEQPQLQLSDAERSIILAMRQLIAERQAN